MHKPLTELSVAFFALLSRDLAIACRRRGEWLHPLMFFVLSISLFAFASSAQPAFLQKISAAVLWVTALLATLLAVGNIFKQDYADGVLEQMLLSPHSPTVLVFAKTLAHWLVFGVPLIIISPLLSGMLSLPRHVWPELLLSLLLGTPSMSLIGALGVALTLAARGNEALLALLILPLYIPLLIFGAGAVRAALNGIDPSGQFLLLGAILLLTLALAPLAIVAALRISLN